MGFFTIYFSTIVASFALDLMRDLMIYKDAADLGFKFESKKLHEFNTTYNHYNYRINRIAIFIPFYNLINVFKKVVGYSKNKKQVLNHLVRLGFLKEMCEYEKYEYSRHPNGINAILVPTIYDIKLENASKISIDNNGQKLEVFYDIDKKTNEIIIYKTNGYSDGLTSENLREKICEVYCKLACVLTDALNEKVSEVQKNSTFVKPNDKNNMQTLINLKKNLIRIEKISSKERENPKVKKKIK